MLSQEEKYRDRKFCLLLYPEDKSHCDALEKIKQSYDCAYILHDKDVDSDGVIKKAHWHVVLRFNNQKWDTAIAKDLGIARNYVQKCGNFDNALAYLIHMNDNDKYQYSLTDVKGNLSYKLKEIVNSLSKTEGEKVCDLIGFIEENEYLTVKELSLYCAKNGYWSEFRRGASIFLKILEEHNKKYI